MKVVWIVAVAIVVQAAAIASGAAQDYPVRDIRVLSGQAAGSGADAIVRFFAEMLRRKLNRNVIVENKPGILGSFAGEALARAPADGHTIFISGYPAVSSNQLLFAKLSYNPVTDFAPVTTLISQPFVLVVSPKSPATTVQELTALLKAKADGGSYGSSSSSGVALSELYKNAKALTTVQVPYRSTSEIMRDMTRGEIDFAFFDSGFSVQQIRGGNIRGLAVSSANRSLALPDVPTMAEAGVPGVQLASWFAVFVPAGTPSPIIQKLNSTFADVLQLDETKKFAAGLGADLLPGTPDSLSRLQKEEIERWRHIVKIAKIAPQ